MCISQHQASRWPGGWDPTCLGVLPALRDSAGGLAGRSQSIDRRVGLIVWGSSLTSTRQDSMLCVHREAQLTQTEVEEAWGRMQSRIGCHVCDSDTAIKNSGRALNFLSPAFEQQRFWEMEEGMVVSINSIQPTWDGSSASYMGSSVPAKVREPDRWTAALWGQEHGS